MKTSKYPKERLKPQLTIVNNSAGVCPINSSFQKKSQSSGMIMSGMGGVSTVCDVEVSFTHEGVRRWCCGERERAGTGRCRPAAAAEEPTPEADTSRWWPAPRHTEPAAGSPPGRWAAAQPVTAWLRRHRILIPFYVQAESPLSSAGAKIKIR